MTLVRHINISSTGMAFDPETGDSFQLNDSAKFILNCLREGISQEETISKVSNEFGISPETALTDLIEFQIQLNLLGFSV